MYAINSIFVNLNLMRYKSRLVLLLLLLVSSYAQSQSLDFLGLSGVSFGMKAADMKEKTLIMDSTSAYKDTAVYLRNTRCHTYFKKNENLSLTGFKASRIEYQFCDQALTYVFVYVKGKTEIENALAQLKKTFTKLGCKKKTLYDCERMDASAKGMRIIVNIDRAKQEMSFVLISKSRGGH
jgi:hypothetical protein